MDLDVTNVNDTLEIAAKATQKNVYLASFAAGVVTTAAVIYVARPKVVAFKERRTAKKILKKNES